MWEKKIWKKFSKKKIGTNCWKKKLEQIVEKKIWKSNFEKKNIFLNLKNYWKTNVEKKYFKIPLIMKKVMGNGAEFHYSLEK